MAGSHCSSQALINEQSCHRNTPNSFKHEGANRPTESDPRKLLKWSYVITSLSERVPKTDTDTQAMQTRRLDLGLEDREWTYSMRALEEVNPDFLPDFPSSSVCPSDY